MASPSWEWKPYTKTIHRSVYPAISPTNPSNSAAGKVVLVTGGGSGLGKHIAIAFNQARAKAIIITGRRENVLREAAAELKKSGDAKVLFYQADVTDEVALNKAFASAAGRLGRLMSWSPTPATWRPLRRRRRRMWRTGGRLMVCFLSAPCSHPTAFPMIDQN